MRILLVTPMPPRPEAPGAIPLVLYAQLRALLRSHDVTLVTFVGPEPGERDAAERLRSEGVDIHWAAFETLAGVPRWQRRARMAGAWLGGSRPRRTVWFADPRIQGILDGLVAPRKYEIAAVEDNAMGVFRLPPTLPAVLTEHEVRRARPVSWHPGPPTRWAGWAFREADWHRWPAYERSIWRRFGDIQVFSERDARGVSEVCPDIPSRVHVNPFGIELPRAANPDRQRPGTLLFVGNFTHPPNRDAVRWLVGEVMPRVRARTAGARLLVVGPGAHATLAGRSSDDVEILGPVAELAPIMDAAAVVLAPVRIGGGMRMKVLHALASGKAVITTSRGTDGLLIGEGAPPLRIADDADAIAESAVQLLNDAAERRRLERAARMFVQAHHSPEAYGRRLEQVYTEVAATGRPRSDRT